MYPENLIQTCSQIDGQANAGCHMTSSVKVEIKCKVNKYSEENVFAYKNCTLLTNQW